MTTPEPTSPSDTMFHAVESVAPVGARRLYLDLDGVMADFDAHFPATFGLDHRGLADDTMWATINAHPSYFRDMPPCPGAVEFFRSIEHLNPIILTACPKSNYPHVARQKRAWVREHLSEHVTVLPVMGGRHKPLFMQEPGDILIDDWRKNIEAWNEAGGVGILHRSFDGTSAALSTLGLATPAVDRQEVDRLTEELSRRSPLTWQEVDGIHSDIAERDASLAQARGALWLANDRLKMLLRAPLPESDHPGATEYVIARLEAALEPQPLPAQRTETAEPFGYINPNWMPGTTMPQFVREREAGVWAREISSLPVYATPVPAEGQDAEALREGFEAFVAAIETGRQREVQAVHAGISRRNWSDTEEPANQLRDRIDRALIPARAALGRTAR